MAVPAEESGQVTAEKQAVIGVILIILAVFLQGLLLKDLLSVKLFIVIVHAHYQKRVGGLMVELVKQAVPVEKSTLVLAVNQIRHVVFLVIRQFHQKQILFQTLVLA
jgi:hypothetical protein